MIPHQPAFVKYITPFVSIISGFLLCVSSVISVAEGGTAVRRMLNPNYYAMTMMTRDIGRMVGK